MANLTSPTTQAEVPSTNEPVRLRDNIAALSVVQLSNYVIPFITLPYLTRVLGPEAYGKVAFAQVVMAYFVLLVDYGFSWSAVRKISARRADRAFTSRVFMGTWFAQWGLVLVSGVCAAFVVLFNERLDADATLYAAAFTAVIGNVLFPIWFLQGLEQLKAVAALRLAASISTLAPIFILITKPSDAILVLFINGGATILGGIFALIWIVRQRLIEWHRPSMMDVYRELREGLPLFGSRVSISFYTTFVPLALGWFAGPVAVANFQVADKLRSAAQSMLSPLSQALYPRMSLLFRVDRAAALSLVRRSILVVIALAGVGGLVLFALSHWIILIIAGSEFASAASVLRWLAFVPLIIGLSNMFGVQIMLPNEMNRIFNVILVGAGVIGVLVIVPLVKVSQENGAAEAVFIVELLVTFTMGAVLQWRGYLFKRKEKSHGM